MSSSLVCMWYLSTFVSVTECYIQRLHIYFLVFVRLMNLLSSHNPSLSITPTYFPLLILFSQPFLSSFLPLFLPSFFPSFLSIFLSSFFLPFVRLLLPYFFQFYLLSFYLSFFIVLSLSISFPIYLYIHVRTIISV